MKNYKQKLQSSAKRGNAGAQYQLAACLATGEGMDRNLEEAAHWYRLASAQKHPEAQYNLGFMYLLGEGVRKNLRQALKLIEQAVKCGSADAAMLLADIYFRGQYGVKKDSVLAAQILLKSFAKGNSRAAVALCIELIESGRLSAKLLAKALLIVAADAGNSSAKGMLRRLM